MACSRFQGSIHILIVFLLVCSGTVFSHSPETQVPGTAENKPYAPFVYTGPAPPLGLPVSGKHNHFPSHPRRNLGTDPDSPPHPSSSGPVHPQHSTLSPSASDHTHSRCYSLAFITYHYLPLQSIWLPPGQPSYARQPVRRQIGLCHSLSSSLSGLSSSTLPGPSPIDSSQ